MILRMIPGDRLDLDAIVGRLSELTRRELKCLVDELVRAGRFADANCAIREFDRRDAGVQVRERRR